MALHRSVPTHVRDHASPTCGSNRAARRAISDTDRRANAPSDCATCNPNERGASHTHHLTCATPAGPANCTCASRTPSSPPRRGQPAGLKRKPCCTRGGQGPIARHGRLAGRATRTRTRAGGLPHQHDTALTRGTYTDMSTRKGSSARDKQGVRSAGASRSAGLGS